MENREIINNSFYKISELWFFHNLTNEFTYIQFVRVFINNLNTSENTAIKRLTKWQINGLIEKISKGMYKKTDLGKSINKL